MILRPSDGTVLFPLELACSTTSHEQLFHLGIIDYGSAWSVLLYASLQLTQSPAPSTNAVARSSTVLARSLALASDRSNVMFSA
jgi:hypothetical protein